MQRKKYTSFILIFSALIIVVVLFFLVFNSSFLVKSSDSRNYNAAGKQISANYFEYSEDILDKKIRDENTLVLFFAAPWCGTCTELDNELEENSSDLPKDLTVFKVNFDTEDSLKKKYNVIYQHTLVQVDSNGKEVTKWVGGDLAAISQNIK